MSEVIDIGPYNAGIKYLKESLGTRLNSYDLTKLELYPDKYHEERLIHTLLGQYYLGKAPQKELKELLIQLDVIKN